MAGRKGSKLTRMVSTITSDTARRMARYVEIAYPTYFRRGETPKGVLVISGMLRHQSPLLLDTFGEFTEGNMDIAFGKLGTSAAVMRDTRTQAEIIEQDDTITVGDYNGAVRTTLGGGVVLYKDRRCRIPVGFAAFSGVPRADGDIALLRAAASHVGLFTKNYPLPNK